LVGATVGWSGARLSGGRTLLVMALVTCCGASFGPSWAGLSEACRYTLGIEGMTCSVGKPTVSVVVTSCNGERFLSRQLSSIAGQGDPASEVIVADDASIDSSPSVAREALASFPGEVHLLNSESRHGLTANLTRCLESASGDVVVFADQDDVWRPNKLTSLTSAFAEHPQADLVFSDACLIDEDDRDLGRRLWKAVGFSAPARQLWAHDPVRVLARRTVVTGATMAVRRSLVKAALPLPTGCWHDEWFALGAVLGGTVPVAIADPLMDYRVHGNNTAGLPSPGARERLAQAGWPRTTRIDAWEEACRRFGPSDAAVHLRGAIALARRRPGIHSRPLQRALRIAGLVTGGDYARYGQGWRMALHDVLAPVLFRGE
jgi:Glycosyl transferase family 2